MWTYLALYLIGYVVSVKVGFWFWKQGNPGPNMWEHDFQYEDRANEAVMWTAIACIWWPMILFTGVVTLALWKPLEYAIKWVKK